MIRNSCYLNKRETTTAIQATEIKIMVSRATRSVPALKDLSIKYSFLHFMKAHIGKTPINRTMGSHNNSKMTPASVTLYTLKLILDNQKTKTRILPQNKNT